MKTILTPIALAAGVLASAAQAQDATQPFDDMTTCSIIYGRVADLYEAKGKDAHAASFRDKGTSFALAASAWLNTQEPQDKWSVWSDQRVIEITGALNQQSDGTAAGDTKVIAAWLDYCSSLETGAAQAAASMTN